MNPKTIRGKAFLVVGHKNWGKSRTLRSLTGENAHVQWVPIAGQRLFVRRMSNDDQPEGFDEFVCSLDPAKKKNVIVAFCPVFEDGDAGALLRKLSEGFNIFSFVIRHAFDGKREIDQVEIDALGRFGPVKCLEHRGDAPLRARALRDFIGQHCG